MALKDYEAARGKVAAIQSRLNRTIEAIRNNKAYSDSGRRAEMARATLQARKEAAALKGSFLLSEMRVGNPGTPPVWLTAPTPTELMVMRDSRDRAAALQNAEDAQLKLKLANQAGDTFMAKAIAQVAAAKGWSDVVESYAETAPLGTRSALEQLADIPSGRMTAVADAASFAIRAPHEFHGHNNAVLEAVAREDEAARLGPMEWTEWNGAAFE